MRNGEPDSLAVLIVEDNPGDRKLTEFAVRDACRGADLRCVVEVADSLAEGVSRVERAEAAFDVILFDLRLPDCDGMVGLRAMQEACPRVPIVVLTGLSDMEVATEALKNGASDYVEKNDLEPRSLFRAIRYAIARKKNETELVRLARTDPLTGLLNRRAFFEQLDSAIVQARRSQLPCAVILFDIDRFKEINDVFGHKTGDDVLVEVGRVLHAALRESDSIARIGGDEFAVLGTNLKSAGDALEIAEKIVRAASAITEVDGVKVEIALSVGISTFAMDTSTADELLAHADLAMYKSKAGKTGTISFFDSRMDESVKARHLLKHSMPNAIDAGRFYLLFQPIVDASSRRLVGAEGLARWRDPEDRVIAPHDFIPIAEETGAISNLGSRLLQEACGQIKGWEDQHAALVPISLNMSPVQCRDPGFAARLINTIETSGILPKMINIEITETAIFKNLDVIRRNLEMLRSYGVGVHIDDFGTGYSSLSVLRELPLTALKIDRSFVRDLGADGGSDMIIQAIIELASKLGYQSIAEGVETETQAVSLREMGVDCLQGYYFSRPVSGGQLAAWLARSQSYLVA